MPTRPPAFPLPWLPTQLTLTVDDELKQKDMVAPLAEVYAAQSTFQTRLTSLLEVYKAECDRMQSAPG